jgi:uncharacterized protein (UPF0261 family)
MRCIYNIGGKNMEKNIELELIVDGKDITINKFVQKVIAGVVAGAVEPLSGVEKDWTDIELTIKR